MSSGYRLSDDAAADIQAVLNHIAAENPRAALRVKHRFDSAFALLATQPDIGHYREDLAETSLRFWTVYSYLIAYRPDTRPIEIVRVLHGARDLGELFT